MHFGRAGKIAFVDLTNGTCKITETEEYSDYLGGRGINQRIMADLADPESDALDPKAPIILAAGILVGTPAPSACRLAVDFKNALTRGVGSANAGGHFSPAMKFAGFDHLVIQGKAPRPTYLFLEGGKIHFRDATDLWGLDTWTTENVIKKREASDAVRTVTIGPAGENLVRFACLIVDRGRAAGYGGAGAVFGSKNLKAVAALPNGHIKVAHPNDLLTESIRYIKEVFEKNPFVETHRIGGTLRAYQLPGQNRPHAVRNMELDFWPDSKIQAVGRDKFDPYEIGRRSCFACPVQCSAIYKIKGKKCEGLQANSWRAFASNLDITDPEQVLELHAFTNLNSLDGDHTSAILAWAVDCYERGLISKSDTGGLELRWGDGKAMLSLLQDLVANRRFGAVMAQGLDKASRDLGGKAREIAVLSRGNALMESGMRTHRAWALGILTSTKGGGHLRGAPAVEYQKLPPQVSRELYGIDNIQDPHAYGPDKAKLVIWYERYKALVDMTGLCYLPSMWMDINLYRPKDIARFITLTTSRKYEPEQLFEIGEKVQTLETLFNLTHAGMTRDQAMPPKKLTEIPANDGQYKGLLVESEKYSSMLDDYYRLRNWNVEQGLPTKTALKKLGLEKDLARLEKAQTKLPD